MESDYKNDAPGPALARLRQRAEALKARPPTLPPQFSARVLRALDEERLARGVSLWKRVAVAAASLSVALATLLVVLWLRPSPAQAPGLVAVRVRLDGAKAVQVAYVEITLPDGVSFFSKAYPELASEKQLVLAWSQDSLPALPIVLQAKQKGSKKVRVKFLGATRELLAEKELTVRFGQTREDG